jgi:hypothetical protein
VSAYNPNLLSAFRNAPMGVVVARPDGVVVAEHVRGQATHTPGPGAASAGPARSVLSGSAGPDVGYSRPPWRSIPARCVAFARSLCAASTARTAGRSARSTASTRSM